MFQNRGRYPRSERGAMAGATVRLNAAKSACCVRRREPAAEGMGRVAVGGQGGKPAIPGSPGIATGIATRQHGTRGNDTE